MERKLLRLLFFLCVGAIPFVFKRRNLRLWMVVFFSKAILATALDNYVVTTGKVKYPIRPFPKLFKTNILFNMLFFPILSIIWVQMTYNSKILPLIMKSFLFSVPMSIAQWWMEKKTHLFKWKQWSAFHTFLSVNFTLFVIRGFVGLIKRACCGGFLCNLDHKQRIYPRLEWTGKHTLTTFIIGSIAYTLRFTNNRVPVISDIWVFCCSHCNARGTAYRSRLLPILFWNERIKRSKYCCIKLYRSPNFIIDFSLCFPQKDSCISNYGCCPLAGVNLYQ